MKPEQIVKEWQESLVLPRQYTMEDLAAFAFNKGAKEHRARKRILARAIEWVLYDVSYKAPEVKRMEDIQDRWWLQLGAALTEVQKLEVADEDS